jgi:predicted  nucleic acid-binding Zn-ribbon protein
MMDQENRPVKNIRQWKSKEIDALRQELLELEDEVAELEKDAQYEPEDRTATIQELQHAMFVKF